MHITLPISKETMLKGFDTGGEWASSFAPGNNFSISITTDSKESADHLSLFLLNMVLRKYPLPPQTCNAGLLNSNVAVKRWKIGDLRCDAGPKRCNVPVQNIKLPPKSLNVGCFYCYAAPFCSKFSFPNSGNEVPK